MKKAEKKMKKINTLEVARVYYFNYLNSNKRRLSDCYAHNSVAKDRAYSYCLELKHKYMGDDLRIIGYNMNKFSVGFIGWYNDRIAFFYITSDYDRVMLLDDIQAKISKELIQNAIAKVTTEIFEEIEKYVIKGISVNGEHLTLFNGKNYAELKKKHLEDNA